MRFTQSIAALFLCALAFAPLSVSAQTPTEGVLFGTDSAKTPTQDAYDTLPRPSATYSPVETVGKIINTLFTFIGIIAVSLIMYGGFLWVSSGGEQEKAKKAQGLFVDAAVGLVVLAIVWAFSFFLLKAVVEQIITP